MAVEDGRKAPEGSDERPDERGRSPNCELLAVFTGDAAYELDRRLSELRP